MGFPPTAKSKINKNQFCPLTNQDWETLDEIEAIDTQNKRPSEELPAEALSKKKKVDKKINKDDDICGV